MLAGFVLNLINIGFDEGVAVEGFAADGLAAVDGVEERGAGVEADDDELGLLDFSGLSPRSDFSGLSILSDLSDLSDLSGRSDRSDLSYR